MFLHSLQSNVPSLHRVALLAIRAHLSTVQIRMAIRAVHTRVGKHRFRVTLRAAHARV